MFQFANNPVLKALIVSFDQAGMASLKVWILSDPGHLALCWVGVKADICMHETKLGKGLQTAADLCYKCRGN